VGVPLPENLTNALRAGHPKNLRHKRLSPANGRGMEFGDVGKSPKSNPSKNCLPVRTGGH
jgi:hypothetical protein